MQELARTALPPDPPATTPIGTLVATAELLELRAAAGEPDARDAAIAVARRIAARDPHGTGAARRLALLLDRAGRTAAAAAAARDALVIDAAKVLDPAKQLAPRDRAELERIAEAGGS